MSNVGQTFVKDTVNGSVSKNLLLELSGVPTEELILLGVIVLCILIVSVAITWISCKLCARDCSTQKHRRSTPASNVYQWDSLTSQRTYPVTERNFGLRLFKPIAQRILEMRSKLRAGPAKSNDENLQQAEMQAMTVNISS